MMSLAEAAGVLGAEEAHRRLLQATVDVARRIFSARASSVFLYDEETDELVFEAVSGEGAEALLGQRIPSSTGIAGWVLVTRQPLVVEELDKDPRFAREAAGGPAATYTGAPLADLIERIEDSSGNVIYDHSTDAGDGDLLVGRHLDGLGLRLLLAAERELLLPDRGLRLAGRLRLAPERHFFLPERRLLGLIRLLDDLDGLGPGSTNKIPDRYQPAECPERPE
jgi:hypothetical protein